MKRSELILLLLAVLTIYTFWNFFSLLFFTAVHIQTSSALIYKDLILVGFLFIPILLTVQRLRAFNLRETRGLFFAILIYSGIVTVLTFLSAASVFQLIYNYRRILLLFLVVFIVLLLDFPKNGFFYWEKFLQCVFWIIFSFGTIEVALGDFVWEQWFPLIAFWDANVTDFVKVTDLRNIGRLYTSDLIFVTGEKHRRMISLILEPTQLGSFFSLVFSYFFVLKKKPLIVLLSFVGGVACFSKLFIICVAVVCFIAPFFRLSFGFLLAGAIFSILVGFFVHTYVGLVHGSLSHVIGLYTGLELAVTNPIGLGIGVGGNRGVLDSSIRNGLMGGESGLGNIFAQIGLFGFIHLFIILKMISIVDAFYQRTGDLIYRATSVCVLAYLINFLFSASSLGTTVHILYFVLFCFAVKRMEVSYK